MTYWNMSIKEDPLPLVRFTSLIDLFPTYSTSVKIVANVAFLLLFLAHVFGIYMQFFDENHQDMNVLISIGTYLGCTFLLYYGEIMTQLKTSLVLLRGSFKSLKSEGPKTYECILRKFKWIKLLHTITSILLCAAIYAACFTDLTDNISTMKAIVAISGAWHIMKFLHGCVNFIGIYGGQSIIATNTYMSFNIGAQFVLLQQFIKRTLHVKCDIYNTRQQEEIFESLKEFVKMYRTTSRVTNHFMERMTSSIIISFFPGVIGCASLTYAVVIYGNVNYFLLIFPITWIVTAFNLPLVGQVVTDESSKIFDIMYDCPWYDWNAKNRKTLLFILTNIKEPIALNFKKFFFLDYSFIIKFYRMSYAIMTCILNTRN